MGNVNPTYHNRVRYTLQHSGYGSLEVSEPVGWRTDGKELSRNKDYHGIFTKFSNNLKFIGSGFTFIEGVYTLYGINTDIRLIRDEKHPFTDEWVRSYEGFLDLSTYSKQNNEISIKFNASGLEQVLKARQSEKFEIETTQSPDGTALGEMPFQEMLFKGRKIFLRSEWATSERNTVTLTSYSDVGGVRSKIESIPLDLIINSHEQAHSTLEFSQHEDLTANTGSMLLLDLPLGKTIKVYVNISFLYTILQRDYIQWTFFKVCLTRYKNGAEYNNPERIDILNISGDPSYDNQTIKAQYNGTITMEKGESLSLEFYIKADFSNPWFFRADFDVELSNITGEVTIEEESFFEPTTAKFVWVHELGKRLTQMITGKENAFYSEALGRKDLGYANDGASCFTGFTHGHWMRGFDRLPLPAPATSVSKEVVNQYKPFATSFKDYLQDLFVRENIGLGIEKNGYQERLRLEDMDYFYRDTVTVTLPNRVKQLKRSVAKEYYYSSVETGYEKGWKNEEAMGLDEYNTKSVFVTTITRIEKKLSLVSKYIAASYAKEFIRRKPKSLFPTQDHPNDKEIFVLDLKSGISGYEERLWEDDFETAPTGVFSPETAVNLRFTPLNILLKHGRAIASGLLKYPSKLINFGSSEGNSHLTTHLKGGKSYSENANILNSDLPLPKYLPEWIEFEHEVTFEIEKQLNASTIVNGKEIPNMYGIIEFINDKNQKEKGYLFNLKPNGSGKWKLLKSNRS